MKCQSSDEDFVPHISDEEDSDGSPSSNEYNMKTCEKPEKMSKVAKKSKNTSHYGPQFILCCESLEGGLKYQFPEKTMRY